MYVLGLGGMLEQEGHDHAACLVEDGRIIAAAEEERFTRVKHSPGQFPVNAAAFCLSQAGITMKDVDVVAYSYLPNLSRWSIRQLAKPRSLPGIIRYLHLCRTQPVDFLKVRFGQDFSPEKLKFIEHHLAHASLAYRLSGFKKAMILSVDGSGEATSTFLGSGNSGEMERIAEVRLPHSLGLLYSAITQFLGFRPDNGEPKVMGLAAYGDPNVFDLSAIVRSKRLGFDMAPWVLNSWARRFSDKVERILGPHRLPGEPIEKRHRDIAASLQLTLEEIVKSMVEDLYEVTGYRKLVLAGGVALNCKMNGSLLDLDFVDEIYVPPAANDAGTALGAAVEVAWREGHRFSRLDRADLGRGYSQREIEEALKLAKVREYTVVDDPAGEAVERMLKGLIVGWFQGRFEFGPRALGNRSILVDPRNEAMKDVLNKYVKHREPFRPFAPSVLCSAAGKYFRHSQEAPFMTIAFDSKPEAIRDLAAAVHVDGTARPQTVRREVLPLYHRLLENFERESGVSGVLNTSFNVAGEPIVASPSDALRTFFGTGIDVLVIGNILVEKPSSLAR